MLDRRSVGLLVLGTLIVAMTLGGALQRDAADLGSMDRPQTLAYIGFAAAAGLSYAVAVPLVRNRAPRRSALWIVLAVAAAARIVTVTAPPLLSTDLYRYVWDGRVQAAGINPYVHLPADPALDALRDHGAGIEAIYPNINRAGYAPTIYPPLAQAIFGAIGLAWPTIWGVKATMLAFDALAIGAALLLLRTAGLPLAHVVVYAWNPLPIWEFAGGGHVDAPAVALSALALLAAAWHRPGWAGAALAGAILCKLLPAALFPALWRWPNLRTPLVCALVIAAGYACYAGAGWRVLGYLPGYASEEGLQTGGGFLALRLLAELTPLPRWAGTAYVALALAALLALAGWIAARLPLPDDPAARTIMIGRTAFWLSTALIVALSPHYPWYFTALLIPSMLAPRPSVLWLTLSAPALYLDHGLGDVAMPAIVFLPCLLLLAFDVRRPASPLGAS